jgi:hypothetical protein
VSKSARFSKKSHYNEDGLKVRREESHVRRLHEKHIRNALRAPHLVDDLEEEDEEY